jgi:hypothetical protein
MGMIAGIKTCASFAGIVVVCSSLLVACASPVKKVSTEFGGGERRGTPPLCFDYRAEAQATGEAGVSNLWAYLNNTCSYVVDCMIYDDVTEKEQRVAVNSYKQLRFLLASRVPANRVRVKLDCSWDP